MRFPSVLGMCIPTDESERTKTSFVVCILEVKIYFQTTHCKTLILYFEKAAETEP